MLFFCGSEFSKKVVIFGANYNTSGHSEKITNNVLVLEEVHIEGNEKKIGKRGKFFIISITKEKTKFCIVMGNKSYLYNFL